MVVDAIISQKERVGSSLSAIKNHLSSKYKIDVNQKAGALNRLSYLDLLNHCLYIIQSFIHRVLKKMREGGVLVPDAPAGRKGSGCFKLRRREGA